jgi:citrate lyase subunit beta/citryl-CoA lyase
MEDAALSGTATTYLFVPGNRPDRFDKALASGADVVVLDLEDAVAPKDKSAARRAIAQWCARAQAHRARLAIRINDAATAWFADELELLRATGIMLAMLPKAEVPEPIARILRAMPSGGTVIPIVETARGVANVDAIASADGVLRLAFGTLDYALDLDLSGDERGLIHAASRLAIASKCAGIASPIAGVTAAIDDDVRLQADVAFARACGFGAKLCIHPRQVEAVHRLFAPTPADFAWAARVVAAAEHHPGVFLLDGMMVDRPVLLKAQAILRRQAGDGHNQGPVSVPT